MVNTKYLKKIFYNKSSPGSFVRDPYKLKTILNAQHPKHKISIKEIQQWLADQEVYTLHRNRRKVFKRNKIYVPLPFSQIAIDLIDLNPYKSDNGDYRYILTVIDCFFEICLGSSAEKKKV